MWDLSKLDNKKNHEILFDMTAGATSAKDFWKLFWPNYVYKNLWHPSSYWDMYVVQFSCNCKKIEKKNVMSR